MPPKPKFTREEIVGTALDLVREKGIETQEGVFQAEMMVRIHNDGPVTILLDSRKLF